MPDAGPGESATVVRGVDGCKTGWVAVSIAASGPIEPRVMVAPHFAELLDGAAILAVDMPIGLPERANRGGRGPESLVRPHLGERQSSVFSVPSRSAVHALDYLLACETAFATSDPPRKVSKQAYFLFPKIREIDALMRADASLGRRVFEVHPELAFWRLNGERPVALPKKVRSAVHPPGLALRRAILVSHGFPAAFLEAVPRGAAADDLLDASVNALIARRLYAGTARSFPDPPLRDAFGLAVAIWA
jgi:predicted RNase H-like nuclease